MTKTRPTIGNAHIKNEDERFVCSVRYCFYISIFIRDTTKTNIQIIQGVEHHSILLHSFFNYFYEYEKYFTVT